MPYLQALHYCYPDVIELASELVRFVGVCVTLYTSLIGMFLIPKIVRLIFGEL